MKKMVLYIIVVFILSGCTVITIKTDETESFAKAMKEKYQDINSCRFTSRSNHSFSVKFMFSSEIDKDTVDEIFSDTREYLIENQDIIIGSEIIVDFIFKIDGISSSYHYLCNIDEMHDLEKWIFFE